MFIEPNSDMRAGANELRALFNAFINAGFSESQAMDLVKTAMMASGQAGAE